MTDMRILFSSLGVVYLLMIWTRARWVELMGTCTISLEWDMEGVMESSGGGGLVVVRGVDNVKGTILCPASVILGCDRERREESSLCGYRGQRRVVLTSWG